MTDKMLLVSSHKELLNVYYLTCTTELEAEPQMHGYYQGLLYNTGAFSSSIAGIEWLQLHTHMHDYTIVISLGLTKS